MIAPFVSLGKIENKVQTSAPHTIKGCGISTRYQSIMHFALPLSIAQEGRQRPLLDVIGRRQIALEVAEVAVPMSLILRKARIPSWGSWLGLTSCSRFQYS